MKPNSRRAKNAINALIAMMIGFVIIFILNLIRDYVLEDYNMNVVDLRLASSRLKTFTVMVGFISLMQLSVYIICVVLFIMWFRRAYFNLHLISKKHLRYSEGMAAGAWFIPIFNLFGPYQIATDLFKQSERILVEHDLMEPRPTYHSFKDWWWGLWIAAGVIERVVNIAKNSIDQTQSTLLGFMVVILTIGAGLLAIQMIKNYSEMETLLKGINPNQHDGDKQFANNDLLDSGI